MTKHLEMGERIQDCICHREDTPWLSSNHMHSRKGGIMQVVLQQSPRHSAHHHSVTLGILDRSVQHILQKDLHFHPF